MKYLTNDRNIVRDADLSATNIVPSQVYYRTDEVEKQGGGIVSLTGDYTGDTDATVDVEVLDENGSQRNVSAPTFEGSGNGTMTAITADLTVDPQEVVVTLKDLGTLTRAARTPFQGSAIVARAAGDAGNSIAVTVDQSGVTAALSDSYRYSLQAPVQAGVNEYTGAHLWNFNTPYLNADGTVPTEAPRIRFGDDPQVYRPYKRRVGAQDVFSFSPAPVRDAEPGTPLKLVTGTYSITVTDGVTPQTLTGITTVYDALVALQGATLVTVEGVGPIFDRAPGGQAAVDLSLWTAPYVSGIEREGTTYVDEAEIAVTADADAPAETLAIECIDVSVAGAERWRVRGDVSKTLAQAITGVLYDDGPYSFTIPVPSASAEGVVAEIDIQFRRPSGAGGTLPNFKAYRALAGIGARNGTWVYEYQDRPVYCTDDGEVVGSPNPDCLGLTPEGDDPVTAARVTRRLQRLTTFSRDFIRENTAVPPIGQTVDLNGDGVPVTVTQSSSSDPDIDFVNKASGILAMGLRAIGAESVADIPLHAVSTAYEVDQIVLATVSGTVYRFAANVAGTSGGSAPTWSATLGATVSDGGVTWENVGREAFGMWDDLFTMFKSDAKLLRGMDQDGVLFPFSQRVDSTAYALGDIAKATTVGASPQLVALRATTAGTSAASQPAFGVVELGDSLNDGTAVWEVVGVAALGVDMQRDPLSDTGEGTGRALSPKFYERYTSGIRDVGAAAGIDPDFPDANTISGDGCWQDIEELTRYFACITPDAPYAPVFPNVYYHSSIKKTRDDGTEFYETTREFAFGPQIGCPELLALGDQIVVTIRNVNGVSTYQQGDRFDVQIVRGEPLALTGGQTGNDTLTWSVIGDEGALLDYALDLTAPAAYSDGGIGFTITPGAIPFGLGAQFRFSVQAARAQWRIDGGSWSSPFTIGTAPVALTAGLSAVFTEGVAPSWVPGDRWSFLAKATNGVDNLRSPTDARTQWTGSTVIDVDPAGGGAITGIMLGDHTIPADATITLTGSDDGFATTPFSETIPWRRGSIWRALSANRAAYRLTIDRGGSLNWLCLLDPVQLELRGGADELGALTMRYRLPGAARRAGLGATAVHDGVSQESFDDWLAAIESACSDDDRRIGIVPVDTAPECGIVTVDADSLEVSDVFQFQPADPSQRLLAFSVDMAPIA